MIGMNREVLSKEAPHSPTMLEIVEAMLGEGPLDAALLAKLTDLKTEDDRAKAQAQLVEEDWANLGRHQGANAALIASGECPDLVFMGTPSR